MNLILWAAIRIIFFHTGQDLVSIFNERRPADKQKKYSNIKIEFIGCLFYVLMFVTVFLFFYLIT
jgi:hypothetical protein